MPTRSSRRDQSRPGIYIYLYMYIYIYPPRTHGRKHAVHVSTYISLVVFMLCFFFSSFFVFAGTTALAVRADLLAGRQREHARHASGVPPGVQAARGRHALEHSGADADVVRRGGVEGLRHTGARGACSWCCSACVRREEEEGGCVGKEGVGGWMEEGRKVGW